MSDAVLIESEHPVESGNAAAKAESLVRLSNRILADLKPETALLYRHNGQRTGFIFLDMQDASQIPAIAEPWFLAFNASLEIHPVDTGRPRQGRRRHRGGGQEIRLIARSRSNASESLKQSLCLGVLLVSGHRH